MVTPLPPILHGPITPISPEARVTGVLSGADVTLLVDNIAVGFAAAVAPGEVWVPITRPLAVGHQVSVMQAVGPDKSPVSDHPVQIVALPNPFPSPVFGSPLSDCMTWVWLDGLVPGATIELRQGSNTVAKVKAGRAAQWVLLDAAVPLATTLTLVATQTATVGGVVLTSPTVTSTPLLHIQREPAPPAPGVGQPAYECQNFIDFFNAVPTAVIEVDNEGQKSEWPAIGVLFRGVSTPPLKQGKLVVKQTFPRCKIDSATATYKVNPPQTPPQPTILTTLCPKVDRVTVTNLWPGAILTLFQVATSGGTTTRTAIGQAGVSSPTEPFDLPPGLPTVDPHGVPYQLVASQTLCAGPSPDSAPVGYAPAGGPFGAPKITEPLYECARKVKVTGGHPGSIVQIIRSGDVPQSDPYQLVTPDTLIPVWPPLAAGEVVVARQSGCNADGNSGQAKVQPLPSPLPGVSVTKPVRPSDPTVVVTGCLPGARIHLFVNGAERSAIDTYDLTAAVPIPPPALAEKDTVYAIQTLCNQAGRQPNDPTTVTKGKMDVTVSPSTIQRGTTANVTVSARDADTHQPVPSAAVFLGGTQFATSGVSFQYSPHLGAANPAGKVTEPIAHLDSAFSITLSDPPPKPKGILHLNVRPAELILSTLRIIGVTWVVTPLWAPGTSQTVNGTNASVTLPDPPAAPNNVVSITITVSCELAGQVGDFFFPDQKFNATVTPNPTKLGWAGKDLTAGWLATWGYVSDQVENAVIFVQVQYQGVN